MLRCIIVFCSRVGMHTPILYRGRNTTPAAAFETSFDVTDIIKYYFHRRRHCAISEKRKENAWYNLELRLRKTCPAVFNFPFRGAIATCNGPEATNVEAATLVIILDYNNKYNNIISVLINE